MDLDPSQYNITRAAEVSTLADTVFYISTFYNLQLQYYNYDEAMKPNAVD